MKQIFLLPLLFILSGCLAMPAYYDNEQEIFIEYPEGSSLKIKGHKNITFWNHSYQIKTERSSDSLKAILSKDGFEDKEIEIKSRFTKDKWARMFDVRDEKETEASALSLIPIQSTIRDACIGAYGGTFPYLALNKSPAGIPAMIITVPLGFIAGAIAGFAHDVYNLFYGIPSVLIKNPWYEYERHIDLTQEILTPTLEFKNKCHAKKNMFVGNNTCLSCDIPGKIAASMEECTICANREVRNGFCIPKCNGFYAKSGRCIPCDDQRSYKQYAFSKECSRCPNREMVGLECRLKTK